MRWPRLSSRTRVRKMSSSPSSSRTRPEHALVARPRDVPDDALPLEAGGDRMVPPQLGALAEDDADAPDVAHAVAHRVHARARARGRGRAPAGRTAV